MAYGAYHPRNPRGQQRDKLYREALRLVLAEDPDAPPPKETAADGPMKRLIARAHIAKAEAGDMQAIKELADRLDGKPAQMLVTEGTQDVTMRRALTYQIVHVTKTQEQIESETLEQIESENDGLLIEHKPVDGNGHDDTNGTRSGNGSGYG
jgi:hypothetical protein